MSPYFGWLKHLSFFNYAMEALLVNEMLYLQLVEERYGLNIDVSIARAKWKKIERCIKWIVFVTIKNRYLAPPFSPHSDSMQKITGQM